MNDVSVSIRTSLRELRWVLLIAGSNLWEVKEKAIIYFNSSILVSKLDILNLKNGDG